MEVNDLKINPCLLVRFDDGLVVEDLLRRAVFRFDSPDLGQLFLRTGTKPRAGWVDDVQEIASAPRPVAQRFVDDLCKKNLLVAPEVTAPEKAMEHWVRRNWVDGLLFHCRTNAQKYVDEVGDGRATRRKIIGKLVEDEGPLELFKETKGKRTKLPPPSRRALAELDAPELIETLKKRRTNEPFRNKVVSQQCLSDVLAESTRDLLRIRRLVADGYQERPELAFVSGYTAHEVNVIVFSVDGVAPGVYHYDPRSHELSLTKKGDVRRQVSRAVIGQRHVERACFVVVLTAVWKRYMSRYQHAKAYRNLITSTGSLAHYFLIAAVRNGLSSFVTPALQADRLNKLLKVNEMEEASLYVIGLG